MLNVLEKIWLQGTTILPTPPLQEYRQALSLKLFPRPEGE